MKPKTAPVLCAALSLHAALAGAAPAADGSPGVPVLIYHQIVTDATAPGGEVIALERFRRHMDHLAAAGYTVLSMDDLRDYMAGRRSVPAKSVVLSFDDGWKNVLNAVPVLEQHGFPASFWIITRKGIGWDNLEWPQIQALDAHPLFQVGSHSATHPWDGADNLITWAEGKNPGRSAADTLADLRQSRDDLAQKLGHEVDVLAWPCGWYNETLLDLASTAGYRATLTVDAGLNRRGDDPMRIRRRNVDGRWDIPDLERALAGGG